MTEESTSKEPAKREPSGADESADAGESAPEDAERRTVLSRIAGTAMATGLVAGYGSMGAIALQYLYPARPALTTWTFVSDLAGFPKGAARIFTAPTGATVVVARQGDAGTEADFVALSSTCPHLGCRVQWQAEHDRFFCPCHNGTFDRSGKSTGGPPFEAKQSLPRYPLKVERGLLFIEVPVEKLG